MPRTLARVPLTPPSGLLNPLTVGAFNEFWFRKAPLHQVAKPHHMTGLLPSPRRGGRLEPPLRPQGVPPVPVRGGRRARRDGPSGHRAADRAEAGQLPGRAQAVRPGRPGAAFLPHARMDPGPRPARSAIPTSTGCWTTSTSWCWRPGAGSTWPRTRGSHRQTFRAMYPRVDEWRAVRDRVDPEGRAAIRSRPAARAVHRRGRRAPRRPRHRCHPDGPGRLTPGQADCGQGERHQGPGIRRIEPRPSRAKKPSTAKTKAPGGHQPRDPLDRGHQDHPPPEPSNGAATTRTDRIMIDAIGRPQSVLVLGGSSEIAQAIVDQLVPGRCRTVVLAGREGPRLTEAVDRAKAAGADVAESVAFDATDTDRPRRLRRRASSTASATSIWCIVAAGVLGDQSADELDPAAAAAVITTNFSRAGVGHAGRHRPPAPPGPRSPGGPVVGGRRAGPQRQLHLRLLQVGARRLRPGPGGLAGGDRRRRDDRPARDSWSAG